MAKISVKYACPRKDIPAEKNLRHWIQTALKEMGSRGEVHVRLVGKSESRVLNRDYRGKDKPTNVLSFPLLAPLEMANGLLGDLVVCVPVLQQEAKLQRKSLENHWAHIMVHGVLHLLGFDHVESDQAKQMEKIEIRILKKLKITDPYKV